MKKLRDLAGILFFVLAAAALYGQNVRQSTADVVVLMDTSGTVLPYYEAINKRVLHSIISKFVRKGDAFHLLSFSAVPRYEMSQQIDTESDLSRVVSRFMLLYQLGQSADFLAGIHFAEQYIEKLPAGQEKILIVISDGIFNPPASSPYRHYTDEQVKTALAKTSAAIRARGWKVYYVKLPFPSDAVIKDLDGTFYAGRLDTTSGKLERQPDTLSSSAAIPEVSGGSAKNGGTVAHAPVQNAAVTADKGTASANPAHSPAAAAQDSPDSSHSGGERSVSSSVPAASGNRLESEDKHISEKDMTAETHKTNPSDTSINPAVGSDTGAEIQSDNPKEYRDVSQAFTGNLGIEPSVLPDEGSVRFDTTAVPLVHILFPDHIQTSDSVIDIPLSVINESGDSADISIRRLVIDIGQGSETQTEQNLSVAIPPHEQKQLTLRAALPVNSRSGGSRSIDIRLDIVQGDRRFSQAAAVFLTVQPAAATGLLNLTSLRFALIGLIILIVLLLLLFFIRRSRETASVKPLVRPVQNPPQQEQGTRSAIHYTDKKYYPEQLAPKEDPRNSLNTFSAQTAAAAAANQTEAAHRIDYLAREHTRNMEGRFALLNSAENRMNRRKGFTAPEHSSRIKTQTSRSGMTELFVYNQSTAIGKRNIHVMNPGTSMSIGGSKSDAFLIFLVPFPANLAQIQYDGHEYYLTLLQPEFFPYEQSTTIRNCIGRNITVVSKKGYHVTFVFRGYEDPMIKLNMILTSISNPDAERRNYSERSTGNIH